MTKLANSIFVFCECTVEVSRATGGALAKNTARSAGPHSEKVTQAETEAEAEPGPSSSITKSEVFEGGGKKNKNKT